MAFAIEGNLKLKNDLAVQTALARLDGKLKRKGVRTALREGAKPITKAAKQGAVKDTGLLAVSISAVVRKYQQGESGVAVIGPRVEFKSAKRDKLMGAKRHRKPANYAHLIELGTAPHRQGAFPSDIGFRAFKGGMHPGIKAQAFLEPAFNSRRAAAVTTIRKVLQGVLRSG